MNFSDNNKIILLILYATQAVVTSWNIPEGYNVTNRVKRQSVCKRNEFRCADGQCIDHSESCDGISTCTDGSDEIEEACAGLVCPGFLYKCKYGACVARNARCNGMQECADNSDEESCPSDLVKPALGNPENTGDGCMLPSHPPNGKYVLITGEAYRENSYVNVSTVIKQSCNKGYKLSSSDVFFCFNKEWLPQLNNGFCTRYCDSLLSSETYDTSCYLQNQPVSCESPVEGTIARIRCKPFYVLSGTKRISECKNGAWDTYPSPCEPECGQKIVRPFSLIIGGTSQQFEYPWTVTIYNTSLDQKKYICGGSIISRFFVLSAAHCFTNANGEPYPKDYFTIVAGKYKRDLNINESTMQVRQVKRLYVHEDYRGALQKYRDDIALVEVEKFEMTSEVRPVCLDWNNQYEDLDFKENNFAEVPAWKSDVSNEELTKLVVPFISSDTCKRSYNPDYFLQYYSSDKICAGVNRNETNVCSIDNGVGLYFQSRPMKYYIRGVASIGMSSETECNLNMLYTKVSRYLNWIETITLTRI